MILIAQNAGEYEALKSFVKEKNQGAWVIPGYDPEFTLGNWRRSPMGWALDELLYQIQEVEDPTEYQDPPTPVGKNS